MLLLSRLEVLFPGVTTSIKKVSSTLVHSPLQRHSSLFLFLPTLSEKMTTGLEIYSLQHLESVYVTKSRGWLCGGSSTSHPHQPQSVAPLIRITALPDWWWPHKPSPAKERLWRSLKEGIMELQLHPETVVLFSLQISPGIKQRNPQQHIYTCHLP